VRLARRDPRAQRQQRGGAVQRLNVTLLVHRQDQGLVRRIQVQAHDIAQLLDKVRIPRELEGLDPVRLQAMLFPDPLDRHA
jgi:hypothetical protein